MPLFNSIFDVVIVVGAICGLAMVVGSIYLLRIGILSLKAIYPKGGQNAGLDVAYKDIKLGTQYPAVALFLIGLLFVLGSAILARPRETTVSIATNVSAEDASLDDVKVLIYPSYEPFSITHDGKDIFFMCTGQRPVTFGHNLSRQASERMEKLLT